MKIVLSESQLTRIVEKISQQKLINEYGQKGKWKSKWDKEDAILCLYNSLFGIERLGISKEDLAQNIIGSSVDSLNQQTSNFDFLDGRGGLDRENKLQTAVYEKYGNEPEQKLRKMCLAIIDQRGNYPKGKIEQGQTGELINKGRDAIIKDREDKLRQLGKDPSKFTFTGRKQLHPPTVDDEEPMSPESPDTPQAPATPKDDVIQFLRSIYSYVDKTDPQNYAKMIVDLKDDILFAIDLVGNDLSNKSDNLTESQQLFFSKKR